MTNMSEGAFLDPPPLGEVAARSADGGGPSGRVEPPPSILWTATSPRGAGFTQDSFAATGTFRTDTRFAPAAAPHPPEPQDPLAVSWAEGYLAGAEQARAEAADHARTEAGAREGLTLAFTRLDAELAETLRQRLHDTVAALCQAALTPLALDEDALLARIERAAAMFARADDERVIRLHPDDLALVSPRLGEHWVVLPDPALDRGALRVESAIGGVEDGPAQWRQAIAEAMQG
jgi:flagellar assembly protein FliH